VGTVTHVANGRYTVQAGRDILECLYFVEAKSSDIIAGSDPASTTAVNVYLDDHAGTPIDADFDIVFFC
ncbi:MAG: hypothetical protein ABW008_12115, partial [Acidimicrobiales bacterium]